MIILTIGRTLLYYMNNSRLYQSLVAFFCLLLIFPHNICAQRLTPYDSTYFTKYLNKLTTRVYLSKKYTSVTFPAYDKANDLKYTPNTNLTLGVGATYNNFSLNLSYGFGFINPDDEKGKTKSIDLEIHVYPNKWAIDILGIQHRGMHIKPKGYAADNAGNYYYRPDAMMTLIGLGAYRVINSEKFSYNAAMIQSERQKKSAGSFLYGAEFYYGALKADSNLVPEIKENLFPQKGINKVKSVTAGAGVGYAYTHVFKKHFFVMGSFITNVDVHFSSERLLGVQRNQTVVAPSFIYKAAIGYNNDKWIVTANWAANSLWVKGPSSDRAYSIPTGNYRLILAKRIDLRK